MTKDYYKILGVTEFDTAENIKNAYRKLARKYHPDIAGNSKDALTMFKEINEAYEILSNKIKKTEYDRARRFYNYANKKAEPEFQYKKTTTSTNKKNTNFSWHDFLFKKSEKKEENLTPKKGDNVYSDIEINVSDVINGATKTVNMLQTHVCPNCKGKKFVNGGTCPKCNGKGVITSYKKFSIKIPAGIKENSKIRLAGEGNIGINGGAKGDLYLTIHIKEDSTYKTENLNLYKTVPITPYEAVLGSTIKIDSPNGEISFSVAPNTQNGQKIRLAKCGLVQNNKIGDMIISIEIRIPKKLSNEEIALYEKLKNFSSNDIRENG